MPTRFLMDKWKIRRWLVASVAKPFGGWQFEVNHKFGWMYHVANVTMLTAHVRYPGANEQQLLGRAGKGNQGGNLLEPVNHSGINLFPCLGVVKYCACRIEGNDN